MASPMTGARHENEHRRRAGAYGFSRTEIGTLLVVIGVASVVGIYRWWDLHAAPTTPGWVVEDVLLESAGHETSRLGEPADTSGDTVGRSPRTAISTLIDVNAAGETELARLPGIGPELARRIVQVRRETGPFTSLSDLQRVRGIGPKKAATLAGWVRFGAAAAETLDVE